MGLFIDKLSRIYYNTEKKSASEGNNDMTPNIYELMDQIGCKTWPERWKDIYEDVMTAFEIQGCPMTDPGHIAALAEQYSLLTEQKELYQEAALSVRSQEPLARLLHCCALPWQIRSTGIPILLSLCRFTLRTRTPTWV